MPRSYAEQHVMRPAAVDEMDTYVPASLGEELLERTYLEDVVRPLVRALVHARMGQAERERDTGAVAGAGVVSDGGARGSAYADLEKLRIELEQASQRARHAEAERDDLVRRLERADSDSARMGRPLPLPDRRPLSDQGHRGQEAPHGTGSAAASFAGPGVAVAVSHSENGPAAAVSVTTDTHHSVAAVARTTPSRVSPQTGFMAPRPRAFAESVRPAPSPAPWTGSGPSRSYEEERERERYSSAPRPMMGRMESAPSLSYHPPGGGYVVTPPYSFAHTDPEQQQQAQAQQHDYDSDRPRKQARMRNSFGSHDAQYLAPTRGYAPLPHAHGHGHAHAHAQAAPSEASFPAPRKLASTKNRTCSNCAAPHDAKFRRGPNGPGTLCDRCGSRWKKVCFLFIFHVLALVRLKVKLTGEHLLYSTRRVRRLQCRGRIAGTVMRTGGAARALDQRSLRSRARARTARVGARRPRVSAEVEQDRTLRRRLGLSSSGRRRSGSGIGIGSESGTARAAATSATVAPCQRMSLPTD